VDLKHYVPASIGVFAAVILIVRSFSVPIAPFALVLLVGETLIGLQVEHQRVSRFLEDVFKALKAGGGQHHLPH
jgi:hypothetical protein